MLRQQPIFRTTALEKLSSPERLDQLMQVTDPKGWLALIAISSVVFTAVLWSFLGSMPAEIQGQGILAARDRFPDVITMRSGIITRVNVDMRRPVRAGEVIAALKPESGPEVLLESTGTGIISALPIQAGMSVNAGTVIASVEPKRRNMEALLYVPLSDGQRIREGMKVRITPATVRPELYGFMLGRVISVAEVPSTQQAMQFILNNDELTHTLFAAGNTIQVQAAVEIDPGSVSGLKWSSHQGPPFQISSKTPCEASIILRDQHPIEFVLPSGREEE